jgi:myo-inositol-1(or 4)-monophosphatase
LSAGTDNRDAEDGPEEAGPSEEIDGETLLAAAREAAESAATVHRESRARSDPSKWGEKGRSDFVTEVDVEAERRIVEILHRRFPSHAIVAEEGSGDRGASAGSGAPVRWIVDPLDGTTNWLHGYPEHAVSLAAEDGRGLRAALVLNSATGECFEAARGGGARRDGEAIRVSGIADLRHALVGTGFPFKKLPLLPDYLQVFSRVLRTTSGIRRAGSAALDLCDVACGRLDAFWEYWLMPWDVAAGALILREAGGVFEPLPVEGLGVEASPFRGGGADLGPGAYLASNAALIESFRALVRVGLPAES